MSSARLVASGLTAACACVLLAVSVQTQSSPRAAWLEPYSETATRLIQAATADDFAWRRLAELTDTYGHRLSGSDNLQRAIAWSVETMRRDGLDNVRTEPVMVPKWVRGRESAEIVHPPLHSLAARTRWFERNPPGGVEADVITVDRSTSSGHERRTSRGGSSC